MKRKWAVLAGLALLLAAAAYAASPLYTSGSTGIAVTSTNTTVTFTDNHSGGAGTAFLARAIMVRSATTSANTCNIDFADGTATTSDVPLAPGASLMWPAMASQSASSGVAAIGVICASGQTATFYVEATR